MATTVLAWCGCTRAIDAVATEREKILRYAILAGPFATVHEASDAHLFAGVEAIEQAGLVLFELDRDVGWELP